MLGFSLGKILFTAAVIAVVWYGFKWAGRMQRVRAAAAKDTRGAGHEAGRGDSDGGGSGSAAPPAEDMTPCSVCGDFVAVRAVRAAAACGRENCPYPA